MNKEFFNTYVCVIKECSDHSYYGFFPDFPNNGCSASANNLEEIINKLQISLTMHTKKYIEKKIPLPTPTKYGELQKKFPDDMIQIITVNKYLVMKDTKAVKKTLTIPSYLDSLGKKYGLSFSALLKDALIEKLINQNDLSDGDRQMLVSET